MWVIHVQVNAVGRVRQQIIVRLQEHHIRDATEQYVHGQLLTLYVQILKQVVKLGGCPITESRVVVLEIMDVGAA